MSILNFIIAFFIVLVGALCLITIPSIVQMFKDGFKNYFKKISLLLSIKRSELSESSFLLNTQRNYHYNNPIKMVRTEELKLYFSTVFLSTENIILLKREETSYGIDILTSHNFKKVDNNWPPAEEIRLSYIDCLWTCLLIEVVKKKVGKVKEFETIEDINDLNTILNNTIVCKNRENNLKKLGI